MLLLISVTTLRNNPNPKNSTNKTLHRNKSTNPNNKLLMIIIILVKSPQIHPSHQGILHMILDQIRILILLLILIRNLNPNNEKMIKVELAFEVIIPTSITIQISQNQ